MPEAARDKNDLEVTGRMGDASIYECLGNVSSRKPDANAMKNRLYAVILHVAKNVRPVPADYRDTGQIDDAPASPKRITYALPSSAEVRGPRFNNSACETEPPLDSSIDGHLSAFFKHLVSFHTRE